MKPVPYSSQSRGIKVGDQTLLEACSPRAHARQYCDRENLENLPEVSMESLDLRESKEGMVELEDDWFHVTSFGHHEDNVECVKEAFESLLRVLATKDRSLKDIVKVVMYVDSMENYAEMNKQYVTYFGLNPPVRVCVAPERLSEGSRLCLISAGREGGDRRPDVESARE